MGVLQGQVTQLLAFPSLPSSEITGAVDSEFKDVSPGLLEQSPGAGRSFGVPPARGSQGF